METERRTAYRQEERFGRAGAIAPRGLKPEDRRPGSDSSIHGDPRVAAALEEYLQALEAGEPPSREEFLGRHAEISGTLAECLPGLELVRVIGKNFEDDSSREEIGEQRVGPSSTAFGARMDRLGDYRILREVGRGSMGVVYEAEQDSLGRRVALKVLPFASAIDPRQRQRFLIESQAAAQLHHPHIVPVFAAGFDRGVHFYAMQFIEGKTLAELIRKARGRDDEPLSADAAADGADGADDATREFAAEDHASSNVAGAAREAASGPTTSPRRLAFDPRTVARLGIQAARALEHAHALGVVHRDIKPGNLMVDSAGSLWVTDFGLARFRGDASLTRSGDLVGTLRYMSPEQAMARHGVVDQRTDVYALGLTLYELLTLRPAFEGQAHHDLIRQIATEDPTPPRKVDPSIPRDLETIVIKAACKEPAGRYATAQELADDLERFVDDRPIVARRPNLLERGARWTRRHRQVVVTAATVLALATVIGVAAVALQARKTDEARLTLLDYAKRSFRAVDVITMDAMQGATQMAMGRLGGIERDHMLEIYGKALEVYNETAKLPPTDLESRKIVARAIHRIGMTHAFLSRVHATSAGPDPEHLATAERGYRDAAARFDRILAEAPGDVDARRWQADAIGGWGLGWFLAMTDRPQEAVPYYRRAFDLRRGLALESGDIRVAADELGSLVWLTENFGTLYATLGEDAEAERVRKVFLATARELAGRPWAPGQARELAVPLAAIGGRATTPELRSFGLDMLRLAIRLDPDSPHANNNLSWLLASDPGISGEDVPVALASARKAVAADPKSWANWNTLGAAAYRARDWKAADEALEKSMSLNNGGTSIDWAFMAMSRWRQGKPDEAHRWLDRALQDKAPDPETRRFREEARALLDPGRAAGPVAGESAGHP
ncbi:serine/threonine-protein kinase [Aquisphaera insulae]|uniref:serine/threonine-protein kinase n=1 Tax=Aquisphaera insulae TaxID=2712864 RepID=UPI0013EC17FA|nr:serine/threonine-protein kinase [Aquisphaera insulae]